MGDLNKNLIYQVEQITGNFFINIIKKIFIRQPKDKKKQR